MTVRFPTAPALDSAESPAQVLCLLSAASRHIPISECARIGGVRKRFLLVLEPTDWNAVVEWRERGGDEPELHAHAALPGAVESLCGIPVVVAQPVTKWSGWLEDEWGPLTRCPTCKAAVG